MQFTWSEQPQAVPTSCGHAFLDGAAVSFLFLRTSILHITFFLSSDVWRSIDSCRQDHRSHHNTDSKSRNEESRAGAVENDETCGCWNTLWTVERINHTARDGEDKNKYTLSNNLLILCEPKQQLILWNDLASSIVLTLQPTSTISTKDERRRWGLVSWPATNTLAM